MRSNNKKPPINPELKRYLDHASEEGLARVAIEADTSVAYIKKQLLNRHRDPSPELARRLEKATGGEINRVLVAFPELAEGGQLTELVLTIVSRIRGVSS